MLKRREESDTSVDILVAEIARRLMGFKYKLICCFKFATDMVGVVR